MKKPFYLVGLAALALAGCSDNDFLGGADSGIVTSKGNGEISFAASAKNITRAGEISGKDAADKLGGQFMVYGYKSAAVHAETEKTFGEANLSAVFPFYRVNYVDNSAYSTESNSHSWEYVGGGADYITNPVSVNSGPADLSIEQSIKYWDYAANHYDFLAWAIKDQNEASLEALNTNKDIANKTYNLLFNTPSAASLGNVYVANRVTIVGSTDKNENPADEPNYTTGATGRDDANKYGNYVLFNFRNMAAKVRIGIYETIPGYSVSDVKFYHSSTLGTGLANTGADHMKDAYEAGATAATATLFDNSGVTSFATGGKLAVAYKDYDTSDAVNSNVAVAYSSPSESENFITFGNLTRFQGPEKKEADGEYIGRNSAQATMSVGKIIGENYSYVFPKDGSEMNLQVDYTLTSIDGSGEVIKIKGANAKIPASFTNWLSNYAYTYLFKISDNTNGSSGTPGSNPAGLYPITFDALVVDMVDANTQETITEVARTSSITTYQKGSEVTKESEYKATTPISVVVDGGVALTGKIALYEVKNLGTEKTSEEVIANYANNKVVLTDITSNLTIKDVYAGADGNNQTVGTNMVAEFEPVAGYNYAVKYTAGAGVETWKYIKVAPTASHTETYAISAATTVNVGGTNTFSITGSYNGAGSYPVLGAAKALTSTNTKLIFSENAGTITVNAASDALAADATSGTATVKLNGVAPTNNEITIQGWTLSDATVVACATTGNTLNLKLNGTNNTTPVNVADFKTSHSGITVTAASGSTVTYSVDKDVPAGAYTIKYENAVGDITVKTYTLTAAPTIINGTGTTSAITLANQAITSDSSIDLTNDNTSAGAVATGTATDGSIAYTYTAGATSGISKISYANASCTVEVTHFAVRVSKAILHDKSDIDATAGNIVANGSTISEDVVYVEFTSDGAKTSANLTVEGTGAKIEAAGSKGLYKLTMASGSTTITYKYKGQTFTLWTGTK